jgi:hypothetical protein
MPVGTIIGRITYGGSTAVSGISLYVNSSSLDDNLLYKSLQFKGDNLQRAEVALTKAQHGCVCNGFTFQTWMLSSRSKKFFGFGHLSIYFFHFGFKFGCF